MRRRVPRGEIVTRVSASTVEHMQCSWCRALDCHGPSSSPNWIAATIRFFFSRMSVAVHSLAWQGSWPWATWQTRCPARGARAAWTPASPRWRLRSRPPLTPAGPPAPPPAAAAAAAASATRRTLPRRSMWAFLLPASGKPGSGAASRSSLLSTVAPIGVLSKVLMDLVVNISSMHLGTVLRWTA